MANTITGFWKELQHRKVFKVGAAYLVVAWLVVQVATSVLPQYDTPAWFLRAFILILALGFPVTLVLAWMLDKTPEGLKIERASVGNKRMFAVAAVLAALAIGWYWKGQPTGQGEGSAARSIAVLPFVNMSGDPANEYFSDGISEEILNVLARVPELQVAARTSSFQFKGEKRDVAQIATQLKVRMVLEGSVRKQDERVRITAQLIDAETGYHLWSQTYDRDLKDIFAIQDEIAQAIASELKVRLAGTEGVSQSATGTTDLVAYDLYLRAIALVPKRDVAGLARAIELLQQAVAQDPEFARGWATLAEVFNLYGFYAPDADYASFQGSSKDAAERALALDPLLGEAYAVLGVNAIHEGRYATAVALTTRATLLSPSFAQAYSRQSNALRNVGRLEDAERASRRALELDPNFFIALGDLARQLAAEGRLDEAGELLRHKLTLDPDLETTHCELANLAMATGDYTMAREHYLRVVKDAEARSLVEDAFSALGGSGSKREVAMRVAEGMDLALGRDANLINAGEATLMMLIALEEREAALDYVERIGLAGAEGARTRMRQAGFGFPILNAGRLRCEPRFQAVMAANGLVDGLAAKLCQ